MKPATYVSRNRINLGVNARNPIDRIVQPPPPHIKSTVVTDIIKPTAISTVNASLTPVVAEAAEWLKLNSWPVIPEITTKPNLEPISDLAVVVGYTGANEERYRANLRAMTRMLHASPRPKYFIFVEFVNPGETSHYSNLESQGWDKVIVVDVTEKGANVWQKEAIWNVGARYAFSLEGITKCAFLDADTAYQDNSWCYYIDEALNQYQVIQSFEAFYYAEQPDCTDTWYGPRHVALSTACTSVRGGIQKQVKDKTVPGGSYACTKDFFYNVLGGAWPYSSRGSGDACLWLFLKGTKHTNSFPMHGDFRLSDRNGALTYAEVGYAPLLAMHYNHGPLCDRMYGSRDYLLRKSNTYTGSDIVETDNGSLEWTDTYEGRFMQQATDILFEANKKAISQRKLLSGPDIKVATRNLRQDIYGRIDNEYPLYIVTYYDDSVPTDLIKALIASINDKCQTQFKLLVLTNKELSNVECMRYEALPLIKCTNSWKRLLAFNAIKNENATILFLDPTVIIKNKFVINRCPDKHIYMARPYALTSVFGQCNWDSSIMLFRNISGLYEQYLKDLTDARDRHPEYQFFNPADYINAYAHFNGYTCRNISAQVDYGYRGQTAYPNGLTVAEFILNNV